MKRYFKDDEDPQEAGIAYFEFDGEYNTRKVEMKNGRWSYATEDFRQEQLADQPLSLCDAEIWDHEISEEAFEAAWQEAIRFA